MSAPWAVIGGGVAGVMTARALHLAGREVQLFEAREAVACGCSKANAGILALGHATAWAGPQALPELGRALLGRAPALRVSKPFDPALWRWGLRFLAECTPRAALRNTDKLQRLSAYSISLLRDAAAQMGLAHEVEARGALYLFGQAEALSHHAARLPEATVLDRDALIARDPALSTLAQSLAGGLLSPADAVGDCRRFTVRTADWLAEQGVGLRFGAQVSGFERADGRVSALYFADGSRQAVSGVVIAAGVAAPALLAPFKIRLPIYPVKGYSGTWRLKNTNLAPDLPFVDESALVAVARYGECLRVTAMAEFAGDDLRVDPQVAARLQRYVEQNFGAALGPEPAEFWAGLRPSTPAGPPFLGHLAVAENLWVNAGHGQLGWTMALGAADLLARAVTGAEMPLTDISHRLRGFVGL